MNAQNIEIKIALYITIAALVIAGIWFGIETLRSPGSFDETAMIHAAIWSIFIMQFGALIRSAFLPK